MIEIIVKGENWKDLVKNIEDLASGMTCERVEADISKTTQKKPKVTISKASVKKEKALTHADVRAVMKHLLENNRAKVIELLKKYDALNVSALPDDRLADFIKDAKAIKEC